MGFKSLIVRSPLAKLAFRRPFNCSWRQPVFLDLVGGALSSFGNLVGWRRSPDTQISAPYGRGCGAVGSPMRGLQAAGAGAGAGPKLTRSSMARGKACQSQTAVSTTNCVRTAEARAKRRSPVAWAFRLKSLPCAPRRVGPGSDRYRNAARPSDRSARLARAGQRVRRPLGLSLAW
jgi:hypothetical protein